jgi:hypothetical protein
MLVALHKGGSNIKVEDALDHVWGYGVGLDMTRRDLQGDAKKLGRPWEVGKSFDKSAPCGPLVPASKLGHPTQGAVTLEVNGQRRQTGDLNQMIWKVPEMIAILSEYFELQPGDIVMTGTPSGVGAVSRGDVIVGRVEGVGEMRFGWSDHLRLARWSGVGGSSCSGPSRLQLPRSDGGLDLAPRLRALSEDRCLSRAGALSEELDRTVLESGRSVGPRVLLLAMSQATLISLPDDDGRRGPGAAKLGSRWLF